MEKISKFKTILTFVVIFSFINQIDSEVSAIEWTQLLGTSECEVSNGIAVDSNDNIYITGKTNGDLDGNTNAGGPDILIARYDNNGYKRWTRLLGTSGIDTGTGIAVDSNDNIYITGYTDGDLDGNTYAGGSGADIFIAKYNTTGNKLWTRLLGSQFNDWGTGIAVDSNDNIYITGYTDGDLDGNTNAGSNDIFIVKYDTNGNKLWTQLLGTSEWEGGNGIAVDSNDNIYITGTGLIAKYDTSGNELWTQSGVGTDSIAVDSNNNIYITGGELIAKYDTSGNKLWTEILGTLNGYRGNRIAVDSNDNIYITGKTNGDLDGNTNSGGSDILVARYAASAIKQWTQLLGSQDNDIGRAIAVDSNDNIYITGSTDGVLDGNKNAGCDDIFIVALPKPSITLVSPNGGEVLWVGEAFEIVWTYTEGSSVKIEYSFNRGADWITISESTVNDGSYEWEISCELSDEVLVRISDEGNDAYDVSDEVFSIEDQDFDGDETPDCLDNCPDDPNKIDPGTCGCGTADTDSDGDGTADCNDSCPNDPNKTASGLCGCGTPDTDTDLDGTSDCLDNCPDDPNKIDPGTCGCGVADTDSDGDGTADCNDRCPSNPNKTAPGLCGCGAPDTDTDLDGTSDCLDNCPDDPNKIDPGTCGCGVADTDSDGDGTADCNDRCPSNPNKTAPGLCGCGAPDTDTDSDGASDCLEICPDDPNKIDPGTCGCGIADTDSDGDGTADCDELALEEIIGTSSNGILYWDVAASGWTQMTSSTPTGDIAAGDFTGDGKADVASIWGSGLWYQDGVSLSWTKVTGAPPVSVTAGDMTGDGRFEIIGTWSGGMWYWDVAASSWTKITSSTPTGDIAAGDFNGDGKADVASIWGNGLWYQDGASLGWTKVSGAGAIYLTAGDMTGDGRSEIISTWSSGIWYWDVAAAKWTKMTASTPTGDIAAGDFTGDGKADVASCWDSGLWYQDGATLGWTKVGTAPDSVTAGDVTGD